VQRMFKQMTKRSNPQQDLEEYLRQIRSYQDELHEIGFILTGSITKRYVRCNTPGCKCQTNPKARHGPYYEYTRKVKGKTVTVRLKEDEANLLMEWIENKRRFYKIVSKIERITLEAVEIIRV